MGCGKLLSVWNPGPECYACRGVPGGALEGTAELARLMRQAPGPD